MSPRTPGWSTVPSAAAAIPPAPAGRTSRSSVGRWFLRALAGLVMLAGLMLVLLLVGSATGPTGFFAGFVFSLVPVAIVLPALLWLDRLEAEPVGQLLFAFGWGAVVATAFALLVNSYSLVLLADGGGDFSSMAVLVAPWVEELAKGAAVLAVLLWRRHEFDGVVDGIVYAGLVGLGFAFTENVLYLGRSLQESGTTGLAVTFVLRGIFGPFAHPLFTMATGIGLGVAARTARPWLRWTAPVLGLLVAVVLHALWNLGAVAGLRGFVGAYLVVQVPIFVAAIVFAVWARRREARLIGRHLQVYVTHGWFTPEEAVMLGSVSGRRRARQWAQQVGGTAGRQAMAQFQVTATELAFARDRATRAALGQGGAVIEADLLRRATAHRYGFAGNR
jgi:protease PrsW